MRWHVESPRRKHLRERNLRRSRLQVPRILRHIKSASENTRYRRCPGANTQHKMIALRCEPGAGASIDERLGQTKAFFVFGRSAWSRGFADAAEMAPHEPRQSGRPGDVGRRDEARPRGMKSIAPDLLIFRPIVCGIQLALPSAIALGTRSCGASRFLCRFGWRSCGRCDAGPFAQIELTRAYFNPQ